MLPLLLAPAAAARANLCFTAHGKGELYCREPPVSGKPLAVYDSGQSPQRARTLFFKKGKLCEDRACRRCLATDAEAWVRCGKAARFALRTSEANGDLPRARALLFAASVLVVPVGALVVGLRRGGATSTAAAAAPADQQPKGVAVVSGLLNFAASGWFPLVAALGTGINMFTLVFTAATVVLFLAAVLARRERWATTAIANALGATLGTAMMLYLIRINGDPLAYLEQAYPTVLANPAWKKAMGYMETYGVGGMLLVASLPIFLHPIIAFGLLTGMSDATILAIVLTGRTVKYLVMARVTTTAPHLLRFFGVKASLVDAASAAAKKAQ